VVKTSNANVLRSSFAKVHSRHPLLGIKRRTVQQRSSLL